MDADLMWTLGDRLAKSRKHAGLTQAVALDERDHAAIRSLHLVA